MRFTRITMVSSSLFLAIVGAALLFAPAESLAFLGLASGSTVLAQVASALYLGNAAANWMARGSMIGGIYARPLTVNNYSHFLVGVLVLFFANDEVDATIGYIAMLIIYLVFAAIFSWILFFGPPGAKGRE